MRDSKNIDRLFQENLKDYEVFPPKKSWSAIEKGLKDTPKKRRIIPIWAKISSVAALLLLFFSVGTIYFMPDNRLSKMLPIKNNKNKTSVENEKSTNGDSVANVKSSEKEQAKGKVIKLNSKEILDESTTNNQFASETKEEEKSSNATLGNFALDYNKTNVFDKNKKEIKKDLSKSRFSVATIFAPIYFSSFGTGSGVDSQFNNNETSGGASYAYGVKFAYKLNKKLSIQSGVNLINLGQTTNDVYIAQGVAVVDLSSISNAPINARNNGNISKEGIDIAKENSASLNQVFGYVEIPLELKYNVTSGKIGVNIVGGFSTLLLNKDEVFIETNSFSQSLGNSNNLRSVNFSGNFGVDIDYSIYKNLFINVSPMFKVQTNTFSKTTGDVQSYYLGVYTGLNYKF